MAETLIGVGYELLTHAGHATIDHVSARLKPPTPPAFAPPAWQPPTWTPPAAALTAGAGAGVTAVDKTPDSPVLVDGTLSTTRYGAPNSDDTDMQAYQTGSYADGVAVGTSCLSCTRAHLSRMKDQADAAARLAAAGDQAGAARAWAHVAAEVEAMTAIDWAPELMARTRPEDVAVVESVRACVQRARDRVDTPADAALVLGIIKENERFAVSPAPTARDHAEIERRLRLVDERGNALESDPGARAAAGALRDGRHVLDAAQDRGALYRPETYATARTHFEAAAVALTRPPSPEDAAAVAEECRACSDQFYRAYFGRMATRGE